MLLEYFPNSHAVHSACPKAAAYLPDSQLLQVEMLVAPATDEALPYLQGVHSVSLVSPMASANLPAGQGVQWSSSLPYSPRPQSLVQLLLPECEKVLLGQIVHTEEPIPLLNFPSSQFSQGWPRELIFPASHAVHVVDPTWLLVLPFEQVRHVVAPAATPYLPTSQSRHSLYGSPLIAYLPAAHCDTHWLAPVYEKVFSLQGTHVVMELAPVTIL